MNLLGGRARTRALFPFVSAEVPGWDLLRAVSVGGIPSIYLSSDPLEDLRAYCGSYLRLEVSRAKLYFFDAGVANALAGVTRVEPGSTAFGPALEQIVFCELRAWLAYARDPRPLTFWRTADGSEVDFVVGDAAAIEVKATGTVTRRDLRGLRRLAEETPLRHRIVVCRESAARLVDGVRILPIGEFLGALWRGDLLAD